MVYDCFTFFNELEILELRLNTLNSVVDKFVLVEANLTHQGKPKPLYFQENKDKFAAFSEKIIHVIVSEYPENPDNNSWVYEHHQRNMIREGLKLCKPEDVVIISDVDEIPDPNKVTSYKNSKGIKIFKQQMFYYFLNCMETSKAIDLKHKYSWNGSIMLSYSLLGKPQDLRETAMTFQRLYHPKPFNRFVWNLIYFFKKLKYTFVESAGWHFSYLGGVDRIIKKLEAFAHNEYNKPEYKSPDRIKELIYKGEDIFGRDFRYTFVKLDASFPKYILENKEKFKDLIYLG
jgi:beta-1,4-mannosyl-glycoprotein beta-1,4-N-acetylglucosaminyltransferase